MKQDPTDPTGVVETSSSLQPETVRARDRKAWAAVDLFFNGGKVHGVEVAGHDWDAAAEALGYPSGRAAQLAAERVMEKDAKENPKTLALQRNYAGRRLERLLRSVWNDANDEESETQLQSHDRAVRTVDRWIKLYGLDAPTEVVVHSPTTAQIEAFVSQVVNHGRPELPEGDIFGEDADDSEVVEGEIVDDGEVDFGALAQG